MELVGWSAFGSVQAGQQGKYMDGGVVVKKNTRMHVISVFVGHSVQQTVNHRLQ